MKRFAFVSVFLGLFAVGMLMTGVALAQTGTGGNTTIDVTITNSAIQVSPANASLAINEPFTMTVLNSSDVTRSIELQSVDASGMTKTAMTAGSQAMVSNIAPSERQTVTWTLDQPGNYQLFSAVESGSQLVAPFTVSGAAAMTGTSAATGTSAVTGTMAVTDTSAVTGTMAVTDTSAVTGTMAVTDTSAVTSTTAATATSVSTATSVTTATSVATSTAEAAPALQVTGTVTATATGGTTLPTTGGTDDSMPAGLILIVAGTLFLVTGLFVGRRLVRSH